MTTEVEFIADVLGRLPAPARRRVAVAALDNGYSYPGAARERRILHFYSRYNDKTESFGATEEIYVHEAGHLLEDEFAPTDCWREAQVSDGEFISEYAAFDPGSGIAGDPSGPGGEDFAETYLCLRRAPASSGASAVGHRAHHPRDHPGPHRLHGRLGFGADRPE